MKTLTILIALGCGSLALAQVPTPWGPPFSLEKTQAYQCLRAQGPITLDGILNEAAWDKAQQIERLTVPPRMDWIAFGMKPARQASSLTRVKMLWDDHYLYFGAEMEDRDITCLTPPGHDNPWSTDDIIELFVKPSEEQPWYWEIHVVPSGGTRDYWYARRGAGSDKRWMKYDSGLQAKVTMVGTFDDWTDRDNKWVVEMRIPWSGFERWGGKPKVGDYWRFLVSRYDYSVHLADGVELSAAAPLPWQNFHLFEHYPYLTFK